MMKDEAAIKERLRDVHDAIDATQKFGHKSEYLEGAINALLWVLGERDDDSILGSLYVN